MGYCTQRFIVGLGLCLHLLPVPSTGRAASPPSSRPATTRPRPIPLRSAIRIAATPATQSSLLHPVPDEAAQAKALDTVREVFKDELNPKTPAERRQMARTLFEQGRATAEDPWRFVLLKQACEMAIAAGDPVTIAGAVDAMGETFSVDAVAMKAQGLAAAAPNCLTPEQAGQLADACSTAIDQAVALDRYEEALKLQSTLEAAAGRTRRVDLARAASERRPQLIAMREQADAARQAIARLQLTPDDPEANFRVGWFLCLVKNQWETGLPMLARGSDAAMRAAAEAELAEPAEPEFQAKIADGWWELAISQSGIARTSLQARAAAMYRALLPALKGKGLAEAMAKKRLQDFDQAHFAALRLSRGLNCALYEGQAFATPHATRLDPQINFEWRLAAPAEGMKKDDFSIRWTGQLRISMPGLYTFALIANQGGRLFLDDRELIASNDLSRKRNGAQVNVKLPEGMHAIKLEFWDGGGEAKCRLLWQTPEGPSLVPIPPDAFYHEEDGR